MSMWYIRRRQVYSVFVNPTSKEVYRAPSTTLSPGPWICTRKPATVWFSLQVSCFWYSSQGSSQRVRSSIPYCASIKGSDTVSPYWSSEILFLLIVWLWEQVEETIKIQELHKYQSALWKQLRKQILQSEDSFSKKKYQNFGHKAKKQQSSKFMKLLHGLQGMLFQALASVLSRSLSPKGAM